MTDLQTRLSKLSPVQRDILFERLASVCQRRATLDEPIDDYPVVVPTTPASRWYSYLGNTWSVTRLLELREPLNVDTVSQVLLHLLIRHDALRLRLLRDTVDGKSVCEQHGGSQSDIDVCSDYIAAPTPEQLPLWQFDVSDCDQGEFYRRVATTIGKIQNSLDLRDGPLACMVLFQSGPSRPNFLLLIVHHIVCDALSMTIFLEDFQVAYSQLNNGHPVSLGAQTTSYREWAEHLSAYERTPGALESVKYWTGLPWQSARLAPTDTIDDTSAELGTAAIEICLDAESTRILLRRSHHLNADLHDILLTSLVSVLVSWSWSPVQNIGLINHGRTAPFDHVNLSRTIGCFFKVVPSLFRCEISDSPYSRLASIKAQLKVIPIADYSYQVLRSSALFLQVAGDIRYSVPEPQITFNFMGRATTTALARYGEASLFTRALDLPTVNQGSHDNQGGPLIQLAIVLQDDTLRVSWQYNQAHYRPETVRGLADRYLDELHQYVALLARAS